MSQQQVSAKKQQGTEDPFYSTHWDTNVKAELQVQYSNYKETLQAIAQKIGDVEQETEEHK